MFKHLLVPLDGSRLAETALPAAACLAQTLNATVTLVHVIERKAPQEVHGERHLTDPVEARVYLDEVRGRAALAGLRVEQHVHTSEVSNVARSIVEHVGELAPDLIIMCSHGRGGLRGLLFGNIAQQVIALGTTPVLLVRPEAHRTATSFTCRLLLAPLDGIPAHEEGLCVGAALAKACGAALHLAMVVPTAGSLVGERAATGQFLPGATAAVLEMAQQGGEEYLGHHVAQLKASGLSVTAEVSRGDPTTAIVNLVRRVGADIIILGTHGKTGMDALWAGSVAPKLAGRTHVPLLLVPLRSQQ